jgi:hypothetical protein
MARWRRGDLVEFDGRLAVVVGSADEPGVPADHVNLWFGEPQNARKSEGGSGNLTPVVWTVPVEYCRPALPPDVRH